MFKQISELTSLLKNAREMQAKMEAMQARLRGMTVAAESDDGSIRVTASGVGEILAIDCVHGTDAVARLGELRDLVNAALHRAKELHAHEMSTLAEGFDPSAMQEALKRLGG